MLFTIFFWLFVFSIAIQCGYALYFFTRLFHFPKENLQTEFAAHPVSVIICAKNEARNLEQYLPAVLSQRYSNETGKPMYEVIVVNDASDDDTEQVLARLEEQHSQLWHLSIGKDEVHDFRGKKHALSRVIPHASYPWILLTDADCMPASEYWIHHMTRPLGEGKQIVAGYGAYRYRPGLLNAFIRWETVHTFVQYSSFIMTGKPYMAVGRNLACTKELYAQVQQDDIWNKLPSGDDDLLMAIKATADNTAVVAHKDAFTISEAKQDWSTWLHQKQRHLSTGKFYKENIQVLLAAYAGSHALGWILFGVLMFHPNWVTASVIMAMRCAVYWTIWQSTAFRLQDRNLFLWLPFCDIGWLIYNFALSPYIFWKNKQQWK